jgi:hypothetical protein
VMLPFGGHPETTFEWSGAARGCGHAVSRPASD